MPKKSKDVQYFEAVGRRKEAVARVRLYVVGRDKTAQVQGKKLSPGEVLVNDQSFDKAFTSFERMRCLTPLVLTNNRDRFAVSILVRGGGKNGQVEAIMHGLSRALVVADKEAYKKELKQHQLLIRDSRTRQRRMVGTGGKARRAKQSPKR